MNTDVIRSLYAYNRWANERLLAQAEALPPGRTRERFDAGYESIHDTLAHILGAEAVWLSRWRGVSPPALLGGSDFAGLEAIRDRWAAQHHEIDRFIADLTPAMLAETIGYTNTHGERWAYPLWQMMLHVVNHGTHHRSEVADMLTRAGHPPPEMDLLVYYDERAAARDAGAPGG
jgi:uncharacterized damage-inducible protein DinB